MPRGDGTGPGGKGPGTGRGLGKCDDKGTRSAAVLAGSRKGLGFGSGRKRKSGFRRGKDTNPTEGM